MLELMARNRFYTEFVERILNLSTYDEFLHPHFLLVDGQSLELIVREETARHRQQQQQEDGIPVDLQLCDQLFNMLFTDQTSRR